jgi:hypothetical protein
MNVLHVGRLRRSSVLAVCALVSMLGLGVQPASAATVTHYGNVFLSTAGTEFAGPLSSHNGGDVWVDRPHRGSKGVYEVRGYVFDSACDGKSASIIVTDLGGHVLDQRVDHTGCHGSGTYVDMAGQQNADRIFVRVCTLYGDCSDARVGGTFVDTRE